MSVAVGNHPPADGAGEVRPRVRHLARDALGVALFSAAASTALAVAVTILVTFLGS